MSSFITEARRWAGGVTDKVQTLSNKFSQYVTSELSDAGEDITIRTESRLAEDIIKYCDDNATFGSMLEPVECFPPLEPDYDLMKLFITGEEFGPTLPDRSGFGHHFTNRGIMRIDKGIDYGNGGSLELMFDGRSTYPYMPHNDDFNISDLSIGYSILFRFTPYRLNQTGGQNQCILVKKEDDNNRFGFDITADGRLHFICKNLGSFKNIVTPISSISANYAPRYEVIATYDVPTTTPKLYVNNTLYSTIDNTLPVVQPDTDDFKFGGNSALVSPPAGEEYPAIEDSKLYCGSLQMVKFWREKVLTAAEVGYHYTNKLTIGNIAFGAVAWPGMAFAYEPPP